jgi:hypothetical protein
MNTGLLAILIFVGFFVAGFMWYLLGRTICLLILDDFVWKHFVADWKNFEGDTIAETLMFMFFPISILYIWLSKI